MEESDIRPTDLFKESCRLDEEDVQRVLLHKSNFVDVRCPACDGKDSFLSFEKNGFAFETCNACRTIYVNPRPTLDMLTEHYQNSLTIEYWNETIYPISEEVRRKKIFEPRASRVLDLCRKAGIGNDLLLDLGAGFGTFLEELNKFGYFKNTIAVEPSSKLADSCRSKNLTVIQELAEHVQLDTPADVITNFELVEHLFCPIDFLKQCHRLLKPNGLLVLTTPNALGFDLLVLGSHSDNISAPNHINYFNPQSLAVLLSRAGFTVIETLTPGELDVDIVQNKVKSGAFSLSDQPFLEEILVGRKESLKSAFQKFLAENKLSSHLWVVAQKN